MGKNLIQQARGKGGPSYRSPSFRFAGDAKIPNKKITGTIIDIIHCQGHSAPIAKISYDDKTEGTMIAAENLRVGQIVMIGAGSALKTQNSIPLKEIPEGTEIFNIESQPGDGGKFVRAGGVAAKILTHTQEGVIIILPSKKQKTFHPECKATIGVVAGGGRLEKPILKAGTMHHKKRAKNKRYPMISGSAQSAVDHPFGNKRSSRKSKAKPAPHNASPGRNVGMIRPRRTGRKK